MKINRNNVKLSDLRAFEGIWSGIILLYSLGPLFHHDRLRLWALALSLSLAFISLAIPRILIIPFLLWVKFGEIMGNIVSSIILFLIYYLVITPFGFFIRLFGRDLLDKKFDDNRNTYWIERTIQPTSLKNQF